MGVTSVTLGNFFTTSSGKTVLGGAGGSGLDTQALVTTLVAAKSQPITADQASIKANDAKTTALNTFQGLLTTFQTAADALRNPPGVNNDASNVFAFTTGSVGNGGSAYVGVTTSPGAALQSYNISDITSVASTANQTTGIFTIANANTTIVSASPIAGSAHQFKPGIISINGQSITLNEGDTLNTVAADFNAVSPQTGISATVIQGASGQFQLTFNATNTGTQANFDLTNVAETSVTDTNVPPVLGAVGFGLANPGTNAIFQINGIPVTRQSNTVSDVVNNVTFNILQKTPDSTTNYPVTINPDTTTIQNTIIGFVNAYNAVQTFAAQQTQTNSNGTYTSASVLAENQTFQQTMSDLNSEITAQGSGLSGSLYSSLSDVGITLTSQAATSTTPAVSNVLTVNDGQLTSALSSNFQSVKNLFGFNMVSDSANLELFSAGNRLAVQNFTLTIAGSPGAQTFTANYTLNGQGVSVPMTATAIGNNLGFSLTGPSGSALDGLQLIYGSTNNATVHVSLSQGVASSIYNSLKTATTSNSGTLAVALKGLQTSDTTLNNDITRMQTIVNQYQTQLLAQYSALEKAISSVNTMLQSLNANSNAALTSSGH